AEVDPAADAEALRVDDQERAVPLERVLAVSGPRVGEHKRRAVGADAARRAVEGDGGDAEAASVGPPAKDAAVAPSHRRHGGQALAPGRDVADLPAGTGRAEPAANDAGIRPGRERC